MTETGTEGCGGFVAAALRFVDHGRRLLFSASAPQRRAIDDHAPKLGRALRSQRTVDPHQQSILAPRKMSLVEGPQR